MPAASVTKKPMTMAPGPLLTCSISSMTSGGTSDMSNMSVMPSRKGAVTSWIGMATRTETNAPVTPARKPTTAPSPGVMGWGWLCCVR